MQRATPAKQIVILFLVAFLLPAILYGQQNTNPLKIFILAGQSNMEGKGSVLVMDHQLTVDEKKARFARYKTGDDWTTRDDVWIDYLGGRGRRFGGLTVGYGISQPNSRKLFGPELGFGWTVGDHFDEQVLIIKTAWGGKSLDRDFRPPSRGYPESLVEQFEKAKKRNDDLTLAEYQKTYGHFYRQMIGEIKKVTSDLNTYVPGYKDQGFEIAGFVWFQGWNDQYAPTSVDDYEDNLVAFIKDVRADLKAPDLPFVVGAMGHEGEHQEGKIKQIADAQVAAAEHADFDGNVVTIRTSQFWDNDAQQAYQTHWADKENRNIEKWREFGNDHPYHYLGSPIFFNDVGVAFADAMIELAATETPKKMTRKAIVIGIDGLRPDQLAQTETPEIDRLIREGASCLKATNSWTKKKVWNGESATNWGVLLTGVTPDDSDLTGNSDNEHLVSDDAIADDRRRVTSMFGHLKQHDSSIKTAVFNTWAGIGLDHGSILHNSVSAVDYHFHPTIKASTPERDKVTVRLAADLLAGQRRETGKDVDCVFLHIDQCDSAGHSSTWDSDEYRRSVTQVDELVGQIVNAINRRKNRANEQWLIMITTDHGGPANAKSHGDNSNPEIYTIPMIVWCDGIDQRTIPACSLYDVTPTVLSWMGIKQLPTELRGKSLLSGNERTK